MKSETFRCPHCGRQLQKSAAAWVLGEAGQADLAEAAAQDISCPACGGAISTKAMVSGAYDGGVSSNEAAGCLTWIFGTVAATTLLVTVTPLGGWWSLGISGAAMLGLTMGTDSLARGRKRIARWAVVGALVLAVLSLWGVAHLGDRKVAAWVEGAGGRVTWGWNKRITMVHLQDTGTGDADVERLLRLSHLDLLDLRGTRVTDVGLGRLAQIKSLTYVRVGNTRVTGAGVEALRGSLPGADIRK